MKKCNDCKHYCNINFEDNDYDYIINELKSIRQHIDKTINLLEKRVEKDSIIDEILSTDYDDEPELDYDTIDNYIKALKLLQQRNPYFNNYWTVNSNPYKIKTWTNKNPYYPNI